MLQSANHASRLSIQQINHSASGYANQVANQQNASISKSCFKNPNKYIKLSRTSNYLANHLANYLHDLANHLANYLHNLANYLHKS